MSGRVYLVGFLRRCAGKNPEKAAWLKAIADEIEETRPVDVPSWVALDALDASQRGAVERAYRLGWLRGAHPSGWDEQDDVTSGDAIFDNQMQEDLDSDYPVEIIV